MSAPIMLKALASFLNITPEEIAANFEQIRGQVLSGVAAIERIDARLLRIEERLGLEALAENEGQSDGKEN